MHWPLLSPECDGETFDTLAGVVGGAGRCGAVFGVWRCLRRGGGGRPAYAQPLSP